MRQDEQQNEQQFMTAAEVCQRFRISATTLWRWRNSGLICAPVRIGGRMLWRTSEVNKMADRNE